MIAYLGMLIALIAFSISLAGSWYVEKMRRRYFALCKLMLDTAYVHRQVAVIAESQIPNKVTAKWVGDWINEIAHQLESAATNKVP